MRCLGAFPEDVVDPGVLKLNQPIADDIEEIMAAHAKHAVTWKGWEAIDAVETRAGEASDPVRPRVKLAEWQALRAAARAASNSITRVP